MPRRAKLVVLLALCAAILALFAGARFPSEHWLLFGVYVLAVLLSSGMKVCLLGSDSTMSANFPLLLLAVMQLSPLQAMGLAAISVFAQCKFRVQKLFSLVQIGFNIANAVNAIAVCWFTYAGLKHAHVATATALAAGATAYFFLNTVPVALIVAWTSEQGASKLWRANFAWFLPFYLVGAALAMSAFFLGTHYGVATALLELPAAYTIYRAYNAQIARIRDHEHHLAEMEALHVRTIESLAMAIEAKDHDTHDHLLRVRVYVTELGEALGLSGPEMKAVKTAALLHDIGKLAVPERIINKPGKLTPEEFEVMKIHPVVGADILERVRFPYPVVPIVRAHHEWWNGMGYPDGLSGQAIPIGARILTVVDSFDAIASNRSYRRAMPLSEAIAVIRGLSGTQFDPRVVDALEQRYLELEKRARHEGEKLARLNTEIHVSRGAAPGAGFEQDAEETMQPTLAARRSPNQEPHTPDAFQSFLLIAAVAERMQTLLKKTESAKYHFELAETLALLASALSSLLPCFCLVFYLKENDVLSPQCLQGHSALFFSPGKVRMGEGISGWAAKHEQSIVNGNATMEPNYILQQEPENDLHSALSLPLHDLENGVFGVLSLYAGPANAFSRDHLRALEAAETTITQALKNSGRLPMDEGSRVSASADAFLSIEDAIRKHIAGGEQFAILLCDLEPAPDATDNFPLAAMLRKGVSPSNESLMRWGSLWLLLLHGSSQEKAAARAITVRDTANIRQRAGLPTGVGCACFPEDGQTAQCLIARAEQRMRLDEKQGKLSSLAGVV